MRVEILHISECPNWVEAGERVQRALDDLGLSDVQLGFRLLTTPEEAAEVPFSGSPTLVVDGEDAFPGGTRTTDLACRVYQTEAGFAGLPTEDQITEAIRMAAAPHQALPRLTDGAPGPTTVSPASDE